MATPKVNAFVDGFTTPYTATGNSSKKGFGDIAFVAPVAAALGGQVGRIVAGPTGPIHQYYDTMLAGLLAGLAFNYFAVSSDGNNFAFKDPFNQLAKTQNADGTSPALYTPDGSVNRTYVRRGGKDGYWVNAVGIGPFTKTQITMGYDTILQFLVASIVLVLRHGGLKKNLIEILGTLGGMTIGSEGLSRWQGSNYRNTVQFNYATGAVLSGAYDTLDSMGYTGKGFGLLPSKTPKPQTDMANFETIARKKDGTWVKYTT
jgi:hypothetical protein